MDSYFYLLGTSSARNRKSFASWRHCSTRSATNPDFYAMKNSGIICAERAKLSGFCQEFNFSQIDECVLVVHHIYFLVWILVFKLFYTTLGASPINSEFRIVCCRTVKTAAPWWILILAQAYWRNLKLVVDPSKPSHNFFGFFGYILLKFCELILEKKHLTDKIMQSFHKTKWFRVMLISFLPKDCWLFRKLIMVKCNVDIRFHTQCHFMPLHYNNTCCFESFTSHNGS